MKLVIRAGGIGTRLWPLSRQKNPKQFHSIIGDKTMLRTTYERLAPIVDPERDLFVSINYNLHNRLLSEIPEINRNNIIVETDTRNTGPAMCLEVCFLERFCSKEDVVASLPSDDYISDEEAFRSLLLEAERFLKDNPHYILTPAIKPDYPDTGYSYFKAGDRLNSESDEAIYTVAQVVEKPDHNHCREILDSEEFFAHTGMYLWQLGNIINLFKEKRPEMYDICTEVVDLIIKNDYEKAQEYYSNLEKISIETAITRECDYLAMSVSNLIGWSDLGKWHIIKRILSGDRVENLIKGEVITNETENTMIYETTGKRIIAVNDVKDMVIIDTEDVLFVSSLRNSEDVKALIEKIKGSDLDEYLLDKYL